MRSPLPACHRHRPLPLLPLLPPPSLARRVPLPAAQIEPKFKRKIEAIVRKSGAREDADEPRSKCPISGELIPQTELVCPTTKADIPYCVVTGRHMELDDWCICPNSRMPALYSSYVRFIESQKEDPVTGKPVRVDDLSRLSEAQAREQIKLYNGASQDDDKENGAKQGQSPSKQAALAD